MSIQRISNNWYQCTVNGQTVDFFKQHYLYYYKGTKNYYFTVYGHKGGFSSLRDCISHIKKITRKNNLRKGVK